MGWLGGHLHAFESDGVRYELPDDESDMSFDFGSGPKTIDERKARLTDVLPSITSMRSPRPLHDWN